MQQNEDENAVKGKQVFTSDAMQFHTPQRVQYTMLKIPKTKEWPTRYKTQFVTIMELRETFINRVMKQFNVQKRLPMKVEPPQVEPKGHGNNVLQTEDLEKQAFAIEVMYQIGGNIGLNTSLHQ